MAQYANGWEAARADGWCVTCMKRQHLPDMALCQECREARNQRSRNRNAARPATKYRTRKVMQDVFTGTGGNVDAR